MRILRSDLQLIFSGTGHGLKSRYGDSGLGRVHESLTIGTQRQYMTLVHRYTNAVGTTLDCLSTDVTVSIRNRTLHGKVASGQRYAPDVLLHAFTHLAP